MKKILSVLLTVAMVLSLCSIGAFAAEEENAVKVALDAFSVNGTGEAHTDRESGDFMTMVAGETIKALGWVFKEGTNLKRVYWQYFDVNADTKFAKEPIQDCSNNYRSRNDVADHLYGASAADYYQYATKAGFGLDDSYIELLGVDKLPAGEYYLRFVAEFEDDTTEVLKKKFTLKVVEGTPQEQPKAAIYSGTQKDDVASDASTQVTLSMEGGNFVASSNAGATDPWISFPVNIDTNTFASVTVKYSVEGGMHANNVYLHTASTGYSADAGTWAPHGMDGANEKTFVFATDFPAYAGQVITGIRFPGANAGGKLVIESITFNLAEGATQPVTEQPATNEPQPQTGDCTLAMFAVIAALGMSAAVVFMKKKSF